ncbi:WPP domain-associated protein [Juglans microcarpa x Juglans regia]|uniref:WPP domain-associated protein n=1 Tax=Juglans microcarpa x Juglans regia TaxID=2249226 RepID=UPI001B7DB09A|nr:WPP domain-associated protein [Juglans microcarpa x Juglans regia]
MDEFFAGGMDGRFRVSITDSTMMSIVHHSMDKAHEKVKSKEGIVERLNEMSKFYELAVMQLEGCLMFVQEETYGCILESNYEELLADLKEIRDHLQGRLKESQLAISDKDRELTERAGNEMKLRQALELKERELVSLRANLEIERTKTEGIEEFVLGNRIDRDGERHRDRDGEFCELKNSVHQQVWNIKQKLGPDNSLIEEERNRGFDNEKIEQMGLDIDMLKETLDLAFGKMQKAIFLSHMGPIEQQWRWSIENDTISILIRGLVTNLEESFEAKVTTKQEMQVRVCLSEHWSDLMNEVASLRQELEPFCRENDMQANGRAYWKEQQVGRRQYVAKMIKSHESIIRRQSEDLNRLKREILREKGCLSLREEKDPLNLRRRIQEIVVRLNNFMEWDAKMGKKFGDHTSIHGNESFIEKRVSQFDESINTLADGWEKINKVSFNSHAVLNEEQQNEIRMLRQEKEDLNLKAMILEEIYFTLLRGLRKEFYIQLDYYDLECLIHEGICKYLFREKVGQWNESFESSNIEAQIREEIYFLAFSEALKDYKIVEDSRYTDELGSVEGSVREGIWTAFLRQVFKEWNESTEGQNTASLIREEIYRIVFGESFKSIACSASSPTLSQLQEVKLPEDFLPITSEMVKEFKTDIDSYNHVESLIREDIFHFVIVEAVRDASILHRELGESRIQGNMLGDLHSSKELNNGINASVENKLVRKLDSLSQCFQVEGLKPSAGTDLKERTAHLDLVSLKYEEMDEKNIFEKLLIEDEHTLSSGSSKLEKSSQQLVTSKALFGELDTSLGTSIAGDLECVHDEMTPILDVSQVGKASFHTPNDYKAGQSTEADSVFSPALLGFQQALADFEHIVLEKLGMNILRLTEVKHNLDPLVELVASLRNKELLYRKAFVRRCYNLQKAELEVDLLGDQVDVLLGLLEKIYTRLHQYSPALQQYFEVSDILNLINKELTGGVVRIPNK